MRISQNSGSLSRLHILHYHGMILKRPSIERKDGMEASQSRATLGTSGLKGAHEEMMGGCPSRFSRDDF